jgi:hypothetical protein
MDARETKAVAPYLLRYFTQRPCRRSSCGGASIEAEQTEEVGRIEEDLPRLREAGLAAELAPDRRRLGEVAGGDVLPELVPFGRCQCLPQGFVRPQETIEKRGAILIV